jgi:hypothetical protein
MATTPDHDLPQSEHLPRTPRGRIGLIVAGSLAAGLVAALALVATPFIPAKEGVLIGVVLLGFAFGWALLAVLSVRLSDQPQRWAAAPAVFFALAGLISLLPPGSVVGPYVNGPRIAGFTSCLFRGENPAGYVAGTVLGGGCGGTPQRRAGC